MSTHPSRMAPARTRWSQRPFAQDVGGAFMRLSIVFAALLVAIPQFGGKWEIAPVAAAPSAQAIGSSASDSDVVAFGAIRQEPSPTATRAEPLPHQEPPDRATTPTPLDQFNPDEFVFRQAPPGQSSAAVAWPLWDPAAIDALTVGFTPDVARWLWLLWDYLPQDELRRGLCVISGESSGLPDAHNTAATEADGGSVGLFQIALENVAGRNRVAGLEDEPPRGRKASLDLLLDPQENIRIAAAMWRAEGWLPAWNAQKRLCGLTA